MSEHHEKSSENKSKIIAANTVDGKTTTQLKDNREHSVIQQKLSKKNTTHESSFIPVQRKNNTGLPDHLKTGMESLSNKNLDHVKVHYNSSKPAAVQAHAYAQGSNIHLGPGQEKHLPHELGHVVQQMEGRVKPTMKIGGTAINNDPSLEQEATHMGQRAIQRASFADAYKNADPVQTKKTDEDHTVQFQSMDHLGITGVNYAVMNQAGYSQWQKTAQAKFMSSAHHNGDQVVVTQFQNQNEVQQYLLSNKFIGGLVILEGILALAAGVALLVVSHGVAFAPGLTAISVGVAKIVRGAVTIHAGDKPTPGQKAVMDALRFFEASVALAGAAIGGNIPGMIFGVAKTLRSLLHLLMSCMNKENPSLAYKVFSGIAAALHWIEVTAGFVSGGIDSHAAVGSEGTSKAIKAITATNSIGVSASKIIRSSNQTAGAIKTIGTPPQPDANTPLLA